jgi:TetR/AcrR family tetracycline transcriptional repressor
MDEQTNMQRSDAERLERAVELTDEHPRGQREQIKARIDRERARTQGKITPKQEQIVAAALELLDSGGLSSLSLREIAKRLNIRAPALYWYFKNKEDLVDYMAEAILQSEFEDLRPRQSEESWQDWLATQMVRLRRAMLAHADGGRVVAGARMYPAVTLSKLFEQILVSLNGAGLDLETAYHVAETATRYTFGYVIEEQAAPTSERLAKIDADALMAPFPFMVRALTQMERNGVDRDADFAVGLQYILKGSSGA